MALGFAAIAAALLFQIAAIAGIALLVSRRTARNRTAGADRGYRPGRGALRASGAVLGLLIAIPAMMLAGLGGTAGTVQRAARPR